MTNKNWFDSPSQSFGTANPATDDLLHRHMDVPGDWLTETQYFGLSIPAENIYGFCYLWIHPNLDVVSGGLFICRGLKQAAMQAELFDLIQYNKASSVLTDDLRSYVLPNGYRVDLLEPGRSLRIRYENAERQNAVDFVATAHMPIAMRANNRHFEQSMQVRGHIVLRGKRYDIDNGYTVRDRSWGEMRSEALLPIPSMSWMTGAFGDDFAFNVNAFDNPDRKPEWVGKMKLPGASPLNDGWVWSDGVLSHLKKVDKLTTRDPANGRPIAHDFVMTDEHDRVFHVKGTITAGFPWTCWWNMVVHMHLTRWECNGRIGWGDTQECQWNDYVHLCTDPALTPQY